ncbi:MAG: hemoglobin [Lewinellaceae bacterium]|nr:hypothetical protein [Saprospiraceae bacterium]MCB9333984.1 hemoglobin [Lewinellaceae bacterium]
MTQKQITLVKSSWRLLRDLDQTQVGDLFYSKLFLDHPELRRMFPKEMSGQNQKLIATLHAMVTRLDDINHLQQELTDLAQRHVEYGVRPKHYQYVGAALLWTLESGLGDDWTPATAEAWTTCYQLISGTMIAAAEHTTND